MASVLAQAVVLLLLLIWLLLCRLLAADGGE